MPNSIELHKNEEITTNTYKLDFSDMSEDYDDEREDGGCWMLDIVSTNKNDNEEACDKEAWLYHSDYGIKDLVFEISYISEEGMLKLLNNEDVLKKHIEYYVEQYFD